VPSPSTARRNATILVLFFLFPVLILAVLFLFRQSSLKRSVADQAIYIAESSPKVAEAIGLPIQPGWPIRGRILTRAGAGNADLQIPLHGSRGQGVLSEWAQQDRGKWHICSLGFQSSNGENLRLVESKTSGCEPE